MLRCNDHRLSLSRLLAHLGRARAVFVTGCALGFASVHPAKRRRSVLQVVILTSSRLQFLTHKDVRSTALLMGWLREDF